MDITPYKNGVHSIAEGLRSLSGFMTTPNDPYLMKDAIIRLHHGLETLLKDILFQRNPIFIISDKATVAQILTYYKNFYENKNDYLLDDAQTITPIEALQRIQSLYFGDISEKEYAQLISAFKELNASRNLLQHFAIRLNPEVIIRTLGNLIPKSINLIKSCYIKDNENPMTQRISHVPHAPLDGISSGHFIDIEKDLTNQYKEALAVIRLLEDRYDNLLTDAIKFFKKSSFPSLPLSISVKDRGHVGPPPYMPDIELKGWLNGDFSRLSNNSNRSYYSNIDNPIARYTAESLISMLDNTQPSDSIEFRLVKVAFSIKANITDIQPDKFFQISNAEEYISFIRTPEVNLSLDFEVEAIILNTTHQFSFHAISSLRGTGEITISSFIYGDKPEKPSILGSQKIDLNEKNTSVDFHAFTSSNGQLSDNCHLKIKINEPGNLIFK